MQGHDIIVIGFSAGGIEPLLELVADLPSDLPAALFVVHHFPANSISALPSILSRTADLPVRNAQDREPVAPGHIYVGRPDRHLLIMRGLIRLTRGPREHGNRPALDPLFRSAARSYGSRVIGVVLSGTLDDGTVGLRVIKSTGGLAVVQDPEQATYPGMPSSAIEHVDVDHVVPSGEMGALLARLTREPALPPSGVLPDNFDPELDPDRPEPAVVGTTALRRPTPPGIPSTLTCPECGGLLFEEEESGLLHFRCHVGHAFSEETLMAVQAHALEGALWAAVRALEEKAELGRRLAERAESRGWKSSAARFEHAARDAEEGSSRIRDTLLQGPVRQALESPAEEPEPEARPRIAAPRGSGPHGR
jgi:two-component system, chemotaxis family, protein-glutamate methylesterase/glutaminase